VVFLDRVHGTGFQEIKQWRLYPAIPVEIVEVLSGTDWTLLAKSESGKPSLSRCCPSSVITVM
jgi:hypothetical protein